MAEIYSVLLSKGGVSKSSSSAAICYELGKQYKVLAIDCDPQANLTALLGVEPNELDYSETLASLITDKINNKPRNVKDCIIKTKFNVDLIPASNAMRGIDSIMEKHDIGKEFLLKEIIEDVKDEYDYIFEDSSPTFSLLTINLLVSADYVISPLDLSEPATRGFLDLLGSMQKIQKYFNPNVKLDGVFFAKVKKGTVHATETMVALRAALEKYAIHVYDAFIPDSIKAYEAMSNKEPIGYYDPTCTIAIAYRELVKEFIRRKNG